MTPAEAELRRRIALEGPRPFAEAMGLANAHYYASRDPFGRGGDFITAPEISQMFGELLGLWAVTMWDALRRPDPVLLVELGPGRGTLMADALRAARALPAFRAAVRVHLVETSPVLRQAQERTLANSGATIAWHDSIASLPPGPTLILANEFFDALPVAQFVRTAQGWAERAVGLDADDALVFGLLPPLPGVDTARLPATAALGDVVETSPDSLRIMHDLALRITRQGGALLAIDYGYARSERGDTLQALRGHRFVPLLEEFGNADLTAHVDFAMLALAARAAGGVAHGPVTQRDFLLGLGLAERAARLKQNASPEQAHALDAALERLTDPAPTGMGALFKVLAVTPEGFPMPPGFLSSAQGDLSL
jgi:SAM-dependent MidA family methyltransferase